MELELNNFTNYYISKLKEGKIVYSECTSCSHKQIPPIAHCSKCGSKEFTIKEAKASGTIETYTIIHVPSTKFENETPFPVAIIKLDDGVQVMARIKTDDITKLEVGQKVVAQFDKEKEDTSILYFTLK